MKRTVKKLLRDRGLREGKALSIRWDRGLFPLVEGGGNMDDGNYRKACKGEKL